MTPRICSIIITTSQENSPQHQRTTNSANILQRSFPPTCVSLSCKSNLQALLSLEASSTCSLYSSRYDWKILEHSNHINTCIVLHPFNSTLLILACANSSSHSRQQSSFKSIHPKTTIEETVSIIAQVQPRIITCKPIICCTSPRLNCIIFKTTHIIFPSHLVKGSRRCRSSN